jgi:hypothetical protein
MRAYYRQQKTATIVTTMLSRREKLLYHQIHPAKLTVDIATSLISTWLAWRHELAIGLVVALLPSVVVTLAMLRWMDLTEQRASRFGRYVAYHMTTRATAMRSLGQVGMWISAWLHAMWGIAAGVLVIVLGWTYSLPSWSRRAR